MCFPRFLSEEVRLESMPIVGQSKIAPGVVAVDYSKALQPIPSAEHLRDAVLPEKRRAHYHGLSEGSTSKSPAKTEIHKQRRFQQVVLVADKLPPVELVIHDCSCPAQRETDQHRSALCRCQRRRKRPQPEGHRFSSSCSYPTQSVRPLQKHSSISDGGFYHAPLVKVSKKWCNATSKAGVGQDIVLEPMVDFLDITDSEIETLTDYLMGTEVGCVNGEARHAPHRDRSFPELETNEADVKREINRGIVDAPAISLLKQDIKKKDRCGSDSVGTAQRGLSSDSDYKSRSTATQHSKLLRPLPFVVEALDSVALRTPQISWPEDQAENIRGPGAAAVPSSAARVCQVLRDLEIRWRQNERWNYSGKNGPIAQLELEGFSDEDLGAAARLFDVDGNGHISLEDVLKVFKTLRVGRFVRRRLATTVSPILIALGRHLRKCRITADEFIQGATSSTIDAALLVSHLEPNGFPHGGRGRYSRNTTKREQAQKGARDRAATMAQMNEHLSHEMQLTVEQRKTLLEFVEDNGLVWGAHVDGAIRRARRELAQQRGRRDGDFLGGTEIENRVSEKNLADNDSIHFSMVKHLQGVAATEAEAMVLSQSEQRAQQSKPEKASGFNRCDASLVLDIFARGVGGLRNLSAETAVSLWHSLKRRSCGIHAYEAGCSAIRRFQRLLNEGGMTPQQWFATLESIGSIFNDHGRAESYVSVVSVIAGAAKLGATMTTTTCNVQTSTSDYEIHSVVSHYNGQPRRKIWRSTNSSSPGLRSENGYGDQLNTEELSNFANHLDPCGEGRITRLGFQEGLRDSSEGQEVCPNLRQLEATRRFEAALRNIGCEDVCKLLQMLTRRGKGGRALVTYVRQMAGCEGSTSRGLDVEVVEGMSERKFAVREHGSCIDECSPALRERLGRPEYFSAVNTVRRIDEVIARKGTRLVVEMHKVDTNRSGVVDCAELQKMMEKLVWPCPILRLERKRRRERQAAAMAAAQEADCIKEALTRRMEDLHQSKAAMFLKAVSSELHQRKIQIRDVFREVDKGRSGALGVEDLLKNTHSVLGLALKREEAEVVVSMFDVNGDQTIQCEELEIALRIYRRYILEGAYWARKKPFYEEFPSLLCLFRQKPWEGLLENLSSSSGSSGKTTPKVCREDVVTALKRLRGDSNARSLGGIPSRCDLVGSCDANGRREALCKKAFRKIAFCCQEAGVRTLPAFTATLSRFDFEPTHRRRCYMGSMRRIDLWHWLRLLSLPSAPNVVEGPGVKVSNLSKNEWRTNQGRGSGEGRNEDIGIDRSPHIRMMSGRLLNEEETSLVLEAVSYQPGVKGDAESEASGPFVSVPVFWKLLLMHTPGLWDREEEENLEKIEVDRRHEAIRDRRSTEALVIQEATRKRQAAKQNEAIRDPWSVAALVIQRATRRRQAAKRNEAIRDRRSAAALVIQGTARNKQARKTLLEIRLRRDSSVEKREAALEIQCAVRQRQARDRREERRAYYRLSVIEKERATLNIQCAARQRQARAQVRENFACQLREKELTLRQIENNFAATRIQAAERGRVARNRTAPLAAARALASEKAAAEAREKAASEETGRRIAVATKEREAARAVVTIQCAVRQRLAYQKADLQLSRQTLERRAMRNIEQAAAIKIQSSTRGWLVRIAAEDAAEKAALDAAIAARRAKIEEMAASVILNGGLPRARGGAGWRKKSVIGARGGARIAGLSVQIPA